MANSVNPDQTAPICSGSKMFASILNSSVMLGNYLQQTTSADDIFRSIFFLGALRVKTHFKIAHILKGKRLVSRYINSLNLNVHLTFALYQPAMTRLLSTLQPVTWIL